MVMTPASLRRRCLARPGATQEFPFGEETSVFKVAGKMFALSALGACPLRVSVKCEPEVAEQLRASYPEVRPGYHLNKRHWNTITMDGELPDAMILAMIEDSYDLVVAALPRAKREALGWAPDDVVTRPTGGRASRRAADGPRPGRSPSHPLR
jgi:predicted DNA-binding protein (MmcQ/YjbR family)